MNIGEIIAQKGVVIRGKVVTGKFHELQSIIKAKAHRKNYHPAAKQTAKPITGTKHVSDKGLFHDEMERLAAIQSITNLKNANTAFGSKMSTTSKMTVDEIWSQSQEEELRKLLIRGNFTDIQQRATNKSYVVTK